MAAWWRKEKTLYCQEKRVRLLFAALLLLMVVNKYSHKTDSRQIEAKNSKDEGLRTTSAVYLIFKTCGRERLEMRMPRSLEYSMNEN